MGYTTDFEGQFDLNKELDDETYEFLNKLATTRRMARNVDAKYGVEGEFYVDGGGSYGQDEESNVINHNLPPKTQPGLWCQWIPTYDRLHIEWDDCEKFYNYIEWIIYIIEKVLKPKGYVLNGSVRWYGESVGDTGRINITDNIVEVS